MTDEQLYNLSDDELEKMFIEAKADLDSPDLAIEQEDVVEDLEQPIMESDDDTSTDDTDDATAEDEDIVATDENPDGDTDVDSDEDTKVVDSVVEDVRPVTKHKFKANGKEFEFSDDEVRAQFPKVFGQAMDYTRKMQAIKPWRKTIDAIEQAKLNHDDINLMIDVLKGDKGAVATVLKRTGIDALDLDVDNSNYVAKDYGRNETELAIKDIVEKISIDPEYSTTQRILSKEWDDSSFQELTKNPELIELLHIDVKSGTYSKVMPIAEKLKVYGGNKKSDLDYYKEAAGIYFGELRAEESRQAEAYNRARQLEVERVEAEKARVQQAKLQQQKNQAAKQDSVKRKAAAPTRSVAGTNKITNYLDDSDEAYDEWYKNLQSKM